MICLNKYPQYAHANSFIIILCNTVCRDSLVSQRLKKALKS
ncbi:hypothetical protein HMPREF9554_02553 [Treponema phagedenis F0421]|nr:hypothetical protein HMPREF9554_02553 [Treponema phagedenis F0421]